MKYSLCADIMFVGIGEKGPVWPDTDGIIEAMKLAKANGLSGIEIFSLAGRDLERIAAASKELGIDIRSAVSSAAVHLGNPAMESELIQAFKEDVAMAKVIGCPMIVFNADGYAKDITEEEVLASMEKVLKELAPFAEAEGITILVEPLTGGFFKSSKVAFDLIRKVGSSNVKLIYDIFHFQNIEGQLTESIKANLDLIGDIHGAGAPMRAELTVGEVNYPFILQTLEELGYEGNFCLEFFTFQDREAKVAASCSILK